jgi:hypothetical protein
MGQRRAGMGGGADKEEEVEEEEEDDNNDSNLQFLYTAAAIRHLLLITANKHHFNHNGPSMEAEDNNIDVSLATLYLLSCML